MFDRIGVSRVDLRATIATVLVLLASVAVYRGMHSSTHEATAIGAACLIFSRSVALGRSPRLAHLAGSLVLAAAALAAVHVDDVALSWVAVVGAGAVAGLPRRAPAPATAAEQRHVWALVDATSGDALAPFALRADKSFVFTDDGRAAVGFRVVFGTAVASGDPIGDPTAYADAVDTFVAHAEANGWRPAVLGASARSLEHWRAHGLSAVPIGRDVEVDVRSFTVVGRRYRNLRQAVQRTHNGGVTTQVVAERDLDAALRAELQEVVDQAGKGHAGRGFAMILDGLLTGQRPGTFLAIARDNGGRVVAFQRYGSSDSGRELSLDVPWRRPGAPNGVDERLIADVVEWASQRGVHSVSLTFAAFPELFEMQRRGVLAGAAYRSVHLLDRWIRVESLYRFVRKFHALGAQRYVALRPVQVLFVALAALRLEFGGAPRG